MTTKNTHPADTHEFEATSFNEFACKHCPFFEETHRNSRVNYRRPKAEGLSMGVRTA